MFSFVSDDGLDIHVHEWPPAKGARGVVQLSHGMGEHAARYRRLAEALSAEGFAVYGNDHRGHGLSMNGRPGHLGEDGWNRLVADMATLTRLLKERHPDLPLVLIGHSMGSSAVQHFLLDHGDLLDGAVLAGTTALDGQLAMLERARSRHELYNAGFQPVRTRYDWLSRDEAQVDAYISDPLCGTPLDADGMRDMHAAAARLACPESVPAGLPLYVMVGSRDPLNAGLTLSDLLVSRYRAAGLTDLTYRAYPGARHELFNETNADEIIADLVAWVAGVTG
ncbi:alpha/beta hydrolase [Actinomadura fulvescens]|uniref:Alpha/beta hydrolase n=1 Tax=Actinomadura fulvescens TaxID=46160 RepID=A0ABP6CLP3_9ACTN